VVHHHGRMAERSNQRAGVPAPRVQRHRGDLAKPVPRLGAEPAGHRGPGAVGHQLQQPTALQVDQTGDPPGRRHPGGFQDVRLVQAQGRHPLAGGWDRPPAGRRARAPPASPSPSPPPKSRATAATGWASLPTRRHASARARSVSTARARMAVTRSVQVRTPQAGSRQRQIRLRQHNATGRPPEGRSRTQTVRRPWSSARTPHPTQPTTVAVVWMASCHSPPATSAETTSKPSRSSSLDADALLC